MCHSKCDTKRLEPPGIATWLYLVKATRSSGIRYALQKSPPKIYNQSSGLHPSTCKINKSLQSLDSHCLEVEAPNGNETNGLMGEARAVKHAHLVCTDS